MTNADMEHNTPSQGAGTDCRAALHRQWQAAATSVDELGAAIDALDATAPREAHDAAWQRLGAADDIAYKLAWQLAQPAPLTSDTHAMAAAEMLVRENGIEYGDRSGPKWEELCGSEALRAELSSLLAGYVLRRFASAASSSPAADATT